MKRRRQGKETQERETAADEVNGSSVTGDALTEQIRISTILLARWQRQRMGNVPSAWDLNGKYSTSYRIGGLVGEENYEFRRRDGKSALGGGFG